MVERRTYSSELRAAQSEGTRNRILEALAEVMAEGVESLSIPSVAARAGVSVGTVYRHFGDKAGLVKALMPYAASKTGMVVDQIPATFEDLDVFVRRVFRHFEASDDLMKAAFTSSLGRDARLDWTGERVEVGRGILRRIAPGLSPEDLEHLVKTLVVLTTSDTYREWRDRLGLSSDEVADEVMWTLRTLIHGALT